MKTQRSSVRAAGLRFLSRRDYSVANLREKLETKFPDQKTAIENVISEFLERGWLDDVRFCEVLIREKSELTKWGPQKILWKLHEKGIDRKVTEAAIREFFPEKLQQQIAHALATEKAKKATGKNQYDQAQKVLGFLVNRGFSLSIARTAIDKLNPKN